MTPTRNTVDQLRALRRHPVPAWWRDAKLGIFVHWTPASVPGFAPVDAEIGELLRSGRNRPTRELAVHRMVRDRCGSRTVKSHAITVKTTATVRTKRLPPIGRPVLADWARTRGRIALPRPARSTWCSSPNTQTATASGLPISPTRADPGGTPRDVVGEMAEAVRGAGMRFGIYYCGGLDWSFEPRPMGTMAGTIAWIPRGAYPAYAEAQMLELISAIALTCCGTTLWPREADHLWPLFARYYQLVPDGVVDDRWMPWNHVLSVARTALIPESIDAASRRQTRRDGELLPPKPPHFDVRTPEYLTFTDVRREPWETVRGMDRSFGYNANSRTEHFLSHGDLLWMLADVAAKGGNLLLNVGPAGSTPQIPDEQLTRLGWLADWVGPLHGAIIGTRPWIAAGTATAEGHPLRYTARDDTVFAFVPDSDGLIPLPELRRDPHDHGDNGRRVPRQVSDSPDGVVVELQPATPGPDPAVVAFHRVDASPR